MRKNIHDNAKIVIITTLLGIAAQPVLAQCGGSTTARTASYKHDIVETASSAGQFETLLAAAQAADLVSALKSDGPLTVFAPTDEAFAKLPKGTVQSLLKPENKAQLQAILKYHVVAGKLLAKDVTNASGAVTMNGQRLEFDSSRGKVMIDAARVVKPDIMTSNGVIHVIDTVMLPSSNNIVETASNAEKFNTLLTAAKEAGLADTLAKDGPFTVFAPTDEAFAKLPAGTLESLLKPENRGKLANILKYHVVSGRIYSTEALQVGKAHTLAGQDVRLALADGQARVNDAKLIKTDLDASNGVIHVIDRVILPQ